MSTVEHIAATLGFPVVVLPAAAAGSMESAITFVVDRLIERNIVPVESGNEILTNLLKRETLGSTALGGAVALPHGVSSAVDRVIGILARCSSPVPWNAPDGQPVETICLIIAPVDRPGDYSRVLEQVAQAIKR
jgi:PTS system nitrogen regulatory IIA component